MLSPRLNLNSPHRQLPSAPSITPNMADPLWISISIKSCIAILGVSSVSVIPFPRYIDTLERDCQNYKEPSTLHSIESRIFKVFRAFRFASFIILPFRSKMPICSTKILGTLWFLCSYAQAAALSNTFTALPGDLWLSPPSTEPAISNPFVVSIEGVLHVPVFPL
jgi:hypothetical protein